MTLTTGLLLLGCGGTGATPTNTDTGISSSGISAGTSESSSGSSDDGVLFDMGADDGSTASADDGGDECVPENLPTPNATLQGTVFAPNMQLPISGALVYLTDDPVEPVPDGVYCAACVELACDEHFTLTGPDGSFSLPAVAGPGQQLVVQKGQFLRVIDFDVAQGSNVVPPAQSNLPGQWNPAAGMWIPRIAVYDADPDRVFNVLAKFGLGQVSGNGELVQGTEQFTLINGAADQGQTLDNLATMNQYHIMFVPCASTKYWASAPTVSASRAQNIRDYVEAGGKWYATDHSNEYIKEPFPNYQDFHNPGMPDLQPAYSSISIVVDTDLLAWLQALPPALKDIGGGNPTLNMLPAFQTNLNYSGIEAIHDVIVQDDMGQDVNVGHHSWVEGPCSSCSNPNQQRPMAISGQYGCGRMMYSTFETSSVAHQGLNPQELVLLYMILEIGVCFEDPPPPPPPIE
ncbi:hypothetical protein DB30_02838 [Enhygromyxa salina]|uniref:Uncharacterized protein n=1 Tax=Enhygromyxa salina TaxID=215803 RepID=A0A0C2D860_9BACT|nr:hypothetical protein DB30_02838 [Enhygromyxa salina]